MTYDPVSYNYLCYLPAKQAELMLSTNGSLENFALLKDSFNVKISSIRFHECNNDYL